MPCSVCFLGGRGQSRARTGSTQSTSGVPVLTRLRPLCVWAQSPPLKRIHPSPTDILYLHAVAPGFPELSAQPYGILANVKAGGAFQQGSWGATIVDAMAPAEGEVVVRGKSGLCGFKSTNAEFILAHRGIRHVVLAGYLVRCLAVVACAQYRR